MFQDSYASMDPRMRVDDHPARAAGHPGHRQPARAAAEDRGDPGPGGPAPGRDRAVPARVLRWAAAAARAGPCAHPEPEAAGRGRAGVRAGRVDPGADPEPDAGPAARPRADLPVHLARPVRGALPVRNDRRDVPGQDGRDRPRRKRCTTSRCTPTPRASSTPSRWPTRSRPRRRRSRGWPASCRPPSTRRPAAGSAPGARGPRSSAPRRSRRCARSPPAGHLAACHFPLRDPVGTAEPAAAS